jgi:hypothetical protein
MYLTLRFIVEVVHTNKKKKKGKKGKEKEKGVTI